MQLEVVLVKPRVSGLQSVKVFESDKVQSRCWHSAGSESPTSHFTAPKIYFSCYTDQVCFTYMLSLCWDHYIQLSAIYVFLSIALGIVTNWSCYQFVQLGKNKTNPYHASSDGEPWYIHLTPGTLSATESDNYQFLKSLVGDNKWRELWRWLVGSRDAVEFFKSRLFLMGGSEHSR